MLIPPIRDDRNLPFQEISVRLGGLAPLGVEYGSGGPLLDLKGTNSVKPGFRHPGTGADTYVTDGFRARLGDTWQM